MMQLKMLFPGYLAVCIEGDHIQKTLSICSFRGIDLYDVTYDDSYDEGKEDTSFNETKKYYCKIPYRKYEDLCSVCLKTNVVPTILSKHGGIYLAEQLKQSASFFIGAILCFFLIILYQTRIWDIRVEGNIYYDSPVILSFLHEKDVATGMKKSEISCIELADQIREAFPKIKWTSVELEGSNLIVHLKENMHLLTEKYGSSTNDLNASNPNKTDLAWNTANSKVNDSNADGNMTNKTVCNELVANKTGIIQSIYVRSGIANVKAGDTCKKGDILVKGQIPIFNDSAEVVRYEIVDVDADVVIKYEQAYYDTIDRETTEYQLKDISKKFHLQILGYHIKPYSILGNPLSKNKADVTHTLNERKQLKITSTFTLPIYYGSNITYEYEKVPKFLTESETKSLLEQQFSYFCDDLEKKGVQIYENNVKIDIMNKKGIAAGRLTVFEKIGVRKSVDTIPKETQGGFDE